MKINSVGFLIIFLGFIVNVFGLDNSSRPQSEKCTTQFVTIDVLVVIYSNTAGGKITPDNIARLKNGIELSREFIWRNSGCQLNLNISYKEIDEFKNKRFFPDNGLLFPKFVENDFIKHGIEENRYGIIVAIYHPPQGGGNYGGMKILGETGYSFFHYPCRTSVRYPGEKTDVDYKATWLFIHEVQHSIDLVCYEGSGVSSMWHGDQPLDYAIQAGEQFSYQAEIFRNFKEYLKIKSPWGRIDQAIDKDGDCLPDNDPRLPADEVRFSSDTTLADTDSDSLSDLEEFMAGIYRGSNPRKKDTDEDGWNDKNDRYPLHPINYKILEHTPLFDETWGGWYLICSSLDHVSGDFPLNIPLNVKIYMNWDENFLYFGCEMDSPVQLHLDIDLLNNGWWHGKDNYRLVIDPFSDRFQEIRVMDATEAARQYRKSLGKGYYEMWDDEPEYIAKFGQILDEFSVVLKTFVYENNFRIKIKIPNNDRIPFRLKAGNTIGWRIYFGAPELTPYTSSTTVFEQYQFFDVILY